MDITMVLELWRNNAQELDAQQEDTSSASIDTHTQYKCISRSERCESNVASLLTFQSFKISYLY